MPVIERAEPLAPGARALSTERQAFIRRTYLHLLGTLAAFVLLEVALFRSGFADRLARTMLGYPWLLILAAFMVVGWLASRTAHRARSAAAQYGALAAYLVAQAVILVPMLYLAERQAEGVIATAAQVTLLGSVGLTWVAFSTGKDFSFLRTGLRWGGVTALILIVAAVLFGFRLGVWFSVGMVCLAGAAILYDTSRLLRDFPTDRPAAAALELFASVALMFWYVLRLSRRLHRG